MTVTVTREGDVTLLALDDSKMNAISLPLLEELNAGLDAAAASKAVCIIGNGRALSAGFDLKVMQSGDIDAIKALLDGGARFLMRLYAHPQPTVVAVNGHALAAGALIVLACDTRIGTTAAMRIGLNETAIGMALPQFAWELAAARLSSAHLTRAAIQAEIYSPEGAVEAGYLDSTAEDCVGAALEAAGALAALPGDAYAGTKRSLRAPLVERVLATLDW